MKIKPGDIIRINSPTILYEFIITSIECIDGYYKLDLFDSNYYFELYPYPRNPTFIFYSINPTEYMTFESEPPSISNGYSLDMLTINGISIMKYLNGD